VAGCLLVCLLPLLAGGVPALQAETRLDRLLEQVAEQSTTQEAWLQATWRWNQRTMVEAYRRVGQRDPSWDAAVEHLMEEWALRFTWRYVWGERELAATVLPFIEHDGLDDPMVQYLVGKCLQAAGDAPAALGWYRRASAGFTDSGYPRLRHAFARLRLVEDSLRGDQADAASVTTALDAYFEDLATSVAAGDYAGMERLLIEQVLSDRFRKGQAGDRFLTGLAELAAVQPESWWSRCLQGELAVISARRIDPESPFWFGHDDPLRGAEIRAQLQRAAALYSAAWEQAPDQPHAAAEMIAVASYLRLEIDPRQWFERAVAAQYDFRNAYVHYGESCGRNWGGGYDQMLAFGRECAETGRYETDIPLQLTRVLQIIAHETTHNQQPDVAAAIFGDPELWRMADALLQGVIAEPSRKKAQVWYRSLRVATAWRFGRKDLAARELDRLGRHFYPDALDHYLQRDQLSALRNHGTEPANVGSDDF
jgi:hypothetical protein